jgi:cell division protein FtsB
MNQDLINLLAGAAFSALGWLARILFVSIRELEKDIAKLREELPRTYLPKTEAREAIADLTHEMRQSFERLFKLLDGKADKP